MAVGVIDRLEAVEVDDADGKAGAVLDGDAVLAVELGEEAAPVGQAGQGVEIGDAEVFVRQRLGFGLFLDQGLL